MALISLVCYFWFIATESQWKLHDFHVNCQICNAFRHLQFNERRSSFSRLFFFTRGENNHTTSTHIRACKTTIDDIQCIPHWKRRTQKRKNISEINAKRQNNRVKLICMRNGNELRFAALHSVALFLFLVFISHYFVFLSSVSTYWLAHFSHSNTVAWLSFFASFCCFFICILAIKIHAKSLNFNWTIAFFCRSQNTSVDQKWQTET